MAAAACACRLHADTQPPARARCLHGRDPYASKHARPALHHFAHDDVACLPRMSATTEFCQTFFTVVDVQRIWEEIGTIFYTACTTGTIKAAKAPNGWSYLAVTEKTRNPRGQTYPKLAVTFKDSRQQLRCACFSASVAALSPRPV